MILCYLKVSLSRFGENAIWLTFVQNVLNDLDFSHIGNNRTTFNSYSLLLSIKTLKRKMLFWRK